MQDISKLSPVELARRVHKSTDLNFNPYPKRSPNHRVFCDELLRLTSAEVLRR